MCILRRCISTSIDSFFLLFLFEDAKRDLRDLGMGAYAENNCFNLGKLPYGSLVGSSSKSNKTKGKKAKPSKTKADTGCYDEGVMFATYSTLIGKNSKGTRLDQLVECEYAKCSDI